MTPDQLAEVVVKMKDGKPIQLKDVADVVIGHQPMIGDGIINDGPGLLLIVEKFPWGNTLTSPAALKKALDAHAARPARTSKSTPRSSGRRRTSRRRSTSSRCR